MRVPANGYRPMVEPIPETRQADDEFGPFGVEEDLLEQLGQQAERVRSIVPDCVGLSLAPEQDGVTFTLVASADEIATLDGLQYLHGGPCVDAFRQAEVTAYRSEEPLDERSWQLFAQGTAAAGVASTLSLPILVHGTVTGTVNLYAASDHAFDGHHEELAAIFRAWAPGAVTNADLSFQSRRAAEQTPQRLREEVRLERAIGVLVVRTGLGPEPARELLRAAAERAGVTEVALAEAVLEVARMQESD